MTSPKSIGCCPADETFTIRAAPAASHTNSIIVTGLCESLENRRTIDEIDSTLTAKGPVGAPVKTPAV
jgi:hypothetical protein